MGRRTCSHTRDARAKDCSVEARDICEAALVVEEIVWRGDDETKASPLGPGAALDRLLALPVAGDRTLPNGDTVVIRADLFAVPHACSDPWPSTVFRIYGDTRVGVLALFSDTATRIAFQESWKPGDGESCLRSGVKRPGSEVAVGGR